jgi:uncharacterized protein (TIGR02266 family)
MPESRIKLRLAIYTGPNHKQLMTNYSVNMSSGGVFIETDTTLPVDTVLLVKFKLPDTDTIIACNARVAWINEAGRPTNYSLPPGIGLQFVDLSLEDMHAIRDYLYKGDFIPMW